LKKPFTFLGDNSDYYDQVIDKCKYLGQQNRVIDKVGKLRAVIDVSGPGQNADYIFCDFQRHYQNMANSDIKQLQLTPHFPCAIDVLPSKNLPYKVDTSKLPGTLQKASTIKMSFSIRMYPAGLAFFRLGFYLEGQEGFAVNDLITFSTLNKFPVTINNAQFDLLDYANNVLKGLHKDYNPASMNTRDRYTIVDIIEASRLLTWEQNSKNMFLPLLSLDPSGIDESAVSANLSRKQEIFKIGPRSSLLYLPAAADDRSTHKTVRRLLRNYLELFFIQKFLAEKISDLSKTAEYSFDIGGNWKQILKNGLREPRISNLFSLWDYTSLHLQDHPLKSEQWRNRYTAILQVLDKEKSIEAKSIQAMDTIKDMVSQAKAAQAEVNAGIEKAIDTITKIKGL